MNGIARRPASSIVAETDGGDLVRRSEVRAAALGDSRSEEVSSIIPIDGAHLLQARHLLVGHDAGVEVREQARLLDHADGRGPDVLERRAVPAFGEPVARHRVALLRAVAEREQRLLAPEPPAGLGDRHDLLRGQERPFEPGRRLGERAVVAVVAAQHRERDEDLARVGDGAAVSELAQVRGERHQAFEVRTARREQRLDLVGRQRLAGTGAGERAPERVRGRGLGHPLRERTTLPWMRVDGARGRDRRGEVPAWARPRRCAGSRHRDRRTPATTSRCTGCTCRPTSTR